MVRIVRRSRRRQKNPFIFKLPLVVQQNVIQNLDFIDLIELASCSRKCADLIRNCRLPYDKMDIMYEDTRKQIMIYKNGQELIWWCFNASWAGKRKKFRKINGVRIKTAFSHNQMHSQSLTPELDMQNVISLFTNVFRIPVGEVIFFNIPSFESAIRGIGRCEEALVKEQFYKRVPSFVNLNRDSARISNAQLNCLMENVKPTVDFQMKVLVEHGSRCDIGLDCDTILIHDSHWMTRRSFLNSRFSTLNLYQSELTGPDYIEFVKLWMNSYDTRLKCVVASGEKPLAGFEHHQLPTMNWDETRRGKVHYSKIYESGFDVSGGWDIERNDGLLATFQFIGKIFLMVVWHDRFPKAP